MSDKNTNEKQDIKAQRVKSYFIQATKEIILNEGVENVSIRKVADQAGYTFTTIYNYFKDLNDLLHETKAMMINDVIDHMRKTVPERILELEDIKNVNRIYVDYYLEHPTIFSFFYSYRLRSVSEAQTQVLDFSDRYLDTYQGFATRGVIKEKDVALVAKTIIYTLHGLLALYFSDNGMTKNIIYDEIDNITGYLLGERS